MTTDYETSGIPLDPPGRRIDRLAEALAVIKGLFADGPVDLEGEHYRIAGLEGSPKPVQRPHPPIVIGGGGPPGAAPGRPGGRHRGPEHQPGRRA